MDQNSREECEDETAYYSEIDKFFMEEIGKWIMTNKVTLTHIGNVWYVRSNEAEEILQKWLNNYAGGR